MRRCILILSLVLTAAMLSWGQTSGPLVQSGQDSIQNLNKLQQFKERMKERAQTRKSRLQRQHDRVPEVREILL